MKVKMISLALPLYLVPAWGAGIGLIGLGAIQLWVFLKRGIKIQFIIEAATILAGFALLLVLQTLINRLYQGELYASVANADFREAQTLGWYQISGQINFFYFTKSLFNVFFLVVLLKNLQQLGHSNFLRLVWKIAYLSIFLQALLFLIVEFGGMSELLKVAVGQGGTGGASNHLTQDLVGFRLSLGFYEPSQMSVFMSGIFTVLLINRTTMFEKTAVVLMIIFLFATSRSFAVILLPVMLVVAIKLNSWIAVISGGGAWVVLSFFREDILTLRAVFPVLRSAFERTYVPPVSELSALQMLFGVDFGNLYAFVPVVGLMLQIGLVGILIMFFMLKMDIKKTLATLLFFSIAPQLWYTIPFIALPFIYVGIDIYRNAGKELNMTNNDGTLGRPHET